MSSTDVVSGLRQRVIDVLSTLIPSGARCALLDFPSYSNVGDSAIWLGEKTHLGNIGAKVEYVCDTSSYSEAELRRRVGDGIILLSGGGNLGDQWPELQLFRERVISAFPDRRIIQLPQSIRFRESANLGRARAVFDGHPDLTILARDSRSLARAQREFRARSILCPDMSLLLGALDRPRPAERDIVWLSRTDAESADDPPAAEAVDWMVDERTALFALYGALVRHIRAQRWGSAGLGGFVRAMYDPLARQRLRRGCRLLGTGKVVITDRLHGHILCLLMGIPHVLLDDKYGKLSSFYMTWTQGCTLAAWADTAHEALEQARGLTE